MSRNRLLTCWFLLLCGTLVLTSCRHPHGVRTEFAQGGDGLASLGPHAGSPQPAPALMIPAARLAKASSSPTSEEDSDEELPPPLVQKPPAMVAMEKPLPPPGTEPLEYLPDPASIPNEQPPVPAHPVQLAKQSRPSGMIVDEAVPPPAPWQKEEEKSQPPPKRLPTTIPAERIPAPGPPIPDVVAITAPVPSQPPAPARPPVVAASPTIEPPSKVAPPPVMTSPPAVQMSKPLAGTEPVRLPPLAAIVPRLSTDEPQLRVVPSPAVPEQTTRLKEKPVTRIGPLPVTPTPEPPEHLSSTQPPAPAERLVPRPLPKNGLQPQNRIPPGQPAGELVLMHRLAVESYATIDSYIVKLRRREVVHKSPQPEEVMLFKFRKSPWSAYFKWLGEEGKGREAVFVRGMFGNKLHTLTARNDIPFMPAGKRMSLPVDHPLILAKSRYSITEAGVGSLIDRFGTLVETLQRGDERQGTLRYIGPVRRVEYSEPVEAALQIIPPGVEPQLPEGGRRFWFFDTRLRFPVLIITQNAQQQEVEYYCFERFLFPGRLSDDEFNPDILWKER